jgi:hypothetical protein
MLLQRSKDEPWKCERSTATSRHDCSPWRNSYSHLLDDQMNSIGKNFWTEIARIQAESFAAYGWMNMRVCILVFMTLLFRLKM